MYLVETASLNHIQPQLAGCKNIHLATLGPNKMINFPTITFLNYSVALHVKNFKNPASIFHPKLHSKVRQAKSPNVLKESQQRANYDYTNDT
jgi:hypothetical protein